MCEEGVVPFEPLGVLRVLGDGEVLLCGRLELGELLPLALEQLRLQLPAGGDDETSEEPDGP